MKNKNIEIKHWADHMADKVIEEFGNKKEYVCATGISPSGTIHFGNFRETITTDLIVKALESKGKKVRFFHSWDDYDRLRKIPGNVDEKFEKYIGLPYFKVEDPFGCHESYAKHCEKEYEELMPKVSIKQTYIYQNEMYQNCKYAEEIKQVIKKKDEIKDIINKYRKWPLQRNWYPAVVYCEKCGKDKTKIKEFDGNYSINYKCQCGFENTIDFRKIGIVKLKWRADWAMRWHYEKVNCEPSGKEHSTPGGSRTTCNEIIKAVWDENPPIHLMYDFIILKGAGGKMSGSAGNAIALKDVLEVYEAPIVRYMFASTRPNTEFFISFDLDVFKVYEDFDKCERIYFNKKEAKDEKEYIKQKRIYELSQINIPEKQPIQPSFRHLKNLVQIYGDDFEKIKGYYKKEIKTDSDIEKLKQRTECSRNWVQKYAPDDMKFSVQDKVSSKIQEQLSSKQKKALSSLKERLKQKDYKEKELFEEFYEIIKKENLEPKEFFKAAYLSVISKERGPKLAHFILIIGKEKMISILDSLS